MSSSAISTPNETPNTPVISDSKTEDTKTQDTQVQNTNTPSSEKSSSFSLVGSVIIGLIFIAIIFLIVYFSYFGNKLEDSQVPTIPYRYVPLKTFIF